MNKITRNYFDKEFELRYFEMNKYGAVTPNTILLLLEETAAEHCDYIGHNLYQLEAQNIGWVLISGFVQMDRYPKYKEKIKVRTWLSKYSMVKGWRENIIYDAQDNIIGKARGLWVFFDIERRRPVQIFDDIKEKWSYCELESTDSDITKKIKPLKEAEDILNFKVNRFDTDSNKHVNNTRYLLWIIESIPNDIINNYYLYSIDGRFISEAVYGQTVQSLIKDIAVSQDYFTFSHTIRVKETNKLCATAKTVWKRKNER